jgi:DNA-binding CsgD family transcriptional regulator
MGSSELRLSEVRAALRLVGECRDLGADAAAWRRHAMAGLCSQIGGRAGLGAELHWRRPRGEIGFAQALDYGLTPAESAAHAAFVADGVVNDASIFPHLRRLTGRLVTRSRSQLITPRDFARTAAYGYYREMCLNHQLISLFEFAPGEVDTLTVVRAWGERDFTDRQRRLVRLCHAEIGRLIGPVLSASDGTDRLPRRLRETLQCLLEGDSEKQAAIRLRLSRPTVHQYITALYRYYGVNSRAELLARFIRRPPPR